MCCLNFKRFVNVLPGALRPLKALLLGILTTGSGVSTAQCLHSLAVPESFLDESYTGNSDFNLLIFGNYSATAATVQGKAAVGGNFTFSHSSDPYIVGTGLSEPFNTDNFIVNGEFSNTGDSPVQVRGNFRYRHNSSASDLPVHSPGEGNNGQFSGDLISFGTLKTYFENMSSDYAAQTVTPGASSGFSAGIITLTGTGDVLDYVFTLDATESAINGITFTDIPAGSSITLNLTGTNYLFNNFSAGTFSGDHSKGLLLNFPDAEQIVVIGLDINGSILAPQANLQLLAGATINGRIILGGNLAQNNAAFTFQHPCILPDALPVTISYIGIRDEAGSQTLRWTTTYESGFDRFEVLRSADGTEWTVAGIVPGNNGSQKVNTYAFPVTDMSKGRYFRLKMIDRDGSYELSRIVAASFSRTKSIVFPNPSNGLVYIRAENYRVRITNSLGQIMFAGPSAGGSGKVDTQGWPTGIYFVEVMYADGLKETHRLVRP